MEKDNEIQLTKKQNGLNNLKSKIIHSPPSEESHPVTGPLGETVEETGESLSLTNLII